jgi:hypothetical protein
MQKRWTARRRLLSRLGCLQRRRFPCRLMCRFLCWLGWRRFVAPLADWSPEQHDRLVGALGVIGQGEDGVKQILGAERGPAAWTCPGTVDLAACRAPGIDAHRGRHASPAAVAASRNHRRGGAAGWAPGASRVLDGEERSTSAALRSLGTHFALGLPRSVTRLSSPGAGPSCVSSRRREIDLACWRGPRVGLSHPRKLGTDALLAGLSELWPRQT